MQKLIPLKNQLIALLTKKELLYKLNKYNTLNIDEQ